MLGNLLQLFTLMIKTELMGSSFLDFFGEPIEARVSGPSDQEIDINDNSEAARRNPK